MTLTVDTKHGAVEGARDGDLVVFRGIPYAAPPTGARRFRPPQPPEPWTGVRRADSFCGIAPQPPPARAMFPGEPLEQSEDCLAVNVWTPGLDGARRPVLVWIHGGAFVTGSGASVLYRGHRLARRGDVVVVTINYRLGALGFLAHPDLRDDETGAAGSWGTLDQVAALQWVQDHIEAFGGDPGNVTVFGESAGSMSVSALLAAPAARGLFHRAIAQSGGPWASQLDQAAAVAEQLCQKAGLDHLDVDALRAMPVEKLLEAQVATSLERAATSAGMAFTPAVDGSVLPEPPQSLIAAGSAAGVPVLAGTNLHEMTYFLIGDRSAASMDEDRLLGRLRRTVGDSAEDLVASYRDARRARDEPVAPVDLWVAIESDRIFRIPATRMLEGHAAAGSAAYSYLFTWESPALGGFLRSCHALEIPFVFGSLHDPGVELFAGGGPEATALSDAMMDSWLAFARTGDPSTEALGQWPGYDGADRATMLLGAQCQVVHAPLEAERASWGL